MNDNKTFEEQALKVQEMLKEGIVIAMVHPETFESVKAKIQKIIVHPNLRFIEYELVERGTIMFTKQPSLMDLMTPTFFTKA